MGFGALDDYLDDYLELPVTGRDGVERVYRIEDPPAEDGIRIERITTLAARLVAGGSRADTQQLDDEQELDLYRMCLGDAYDQLRADLSWGRFKHVALTAMMWITADRETAESYWATGNVPGKAPNRAAKRSASRASSAKAAASTTRKPASTSGTRAASPRSRKAQPQP
ncbi:tail assembly chaperone [Streptomyces phage HFrancette]|uniref:Tail assembly chaperone n=2 Tax=Ignaciovirus TaxID=3152509 RepID=A0A9E7NFR2_9CAUD|nr:tail assembly chaperone [Streptomyces phage Ignacio]YP_010756367.1 tail assembly chaperone [Streptomyces phage HFrancette]QKN87542.1 tail assembly chaperone [Streptomyces phage Ignacio]UTN92110.1 tail assembly chaperone [Streptomyces phage HFrancette]